MKVIHFCLVNSGRPIGVKGLQHKSKVRKISTHTSSVKGGRNLDNDDDDRSWLLSAQSRIIRLLAAARIDCIQT